MIGTLLGDAGVASPLQTSFSAGTGARFANGIHILSASLVNLLLLVHTSMALADLPTDGPIASSRMD